MVKRFNSSQFRSKIRQAQSRLRQSVDRVNRVIDDYNRQVRVHNSRVRANRQRLLDELRRLQSRSSSIRYGGLRSAALDLNLRFGALEQRESDFEGVDGGAEFIDLSERENANSAEVANALEEDGPADQAEARLEGSGEVLEVLRVVAPDLEDRWRGAIFSLSPRNPDAARHFCTSSREVFIQMLDRFAPDESVVNANPVCEKTRTGAPTRREKVKFMLHKAGLLVPEAVDFVTEDVQNVLGLFQLLNDGTHGSVGHFGLTALAAIRQRVEHGILYLGGIGRRV